MKPSLQFDRYMKKIFPEAYDLFGDFFETHGHYCELDLYEAHRSEAERFLIALIDAPSDHARKLLKDTTSKEIQTLAAYYYFEALRRIAALDRNKTNPTTERKALALYALLLLAPKGFQDLQKEYEEYQDL